MRILKAKRCYLLVWMCLWLPTMMVAQLDRPMVKLQFDRQNDFTYSTMLDTWFKTQKGRYSLDLRLSHSNIYNSTRAQGEFVQLYFHTDIWQHFQLRPKLELASWIETDQYVNNQNEKINVYAGLRYKPWSWLQVTPLLGYTWDTRTAILGRSAPQIKLDQGLTPAVYVVSSHDWSDQLTMRTELIARYKDISPRRQHNLILNHHWSKAFEEGVTLDAGLHLGSHELDDYQGNSVKRILSDSIMPEFQLTYAFAPGVEWQSENGLLLHRRRFLFQNIVNPTPEENNLTFQGVELGTLQRLSIARKAFRLSGTYEFQYQSRSYDLQNDIGLNASDFETQLEREKQKDFTKNIHRLEFLMALPVGQRQRVEGKVTNQYQQYDTPSETNFDDRDELSWVASTKWSSAWNKAFVTSFDLQGNYRHYAFLYRQKSQDNYVQRSLRLDFDFAWDLSPKLRVEGEQAIYVTYNVKDFTDYNKTDRATRNLESNCKATWRPVARLQGELSFRRKETFQSYLNWEKFSETTLDTNRILTVENRWRYLLNAPNQFRQWYIEGGYKHFDQTKHFKSNMIGVDNLLKAISLRRISLQTGPLMAFGFRHRNQSTIDLGLWMQIQIHKNRYEVLATNQIFGPAQQETALRLVDVELRPYPTARINYYFGGK